MMKLNNRSKLLVVIFIISLLGLIFYKFIYVKNSQKLEAIQTEYNTTIKQYEAMIEKLKLKDKNIIENKELNFEIDEITKGFLPEIEQEKVIVFIKKYLDESYINASSISFSDIVMEVINNETVVIENENNSLKDLKNNLDGVEEKEKEKDSNINDVKIESASVESITLNITYNATYTNLLEFIDSLQNNIINVSITNLNIIQTENNAVQGTMIMKFYAIPKLFDHENNEWEWNDLIDYGKYNPFYEDASYNRNAAFTKYDFGITVKPLSSDLPTIIIGKADDTNRKTYVYADSNAIEDADIFFKEVNNKYYYKYNTTNGSYPTKNEWEEFIPVNDFISIKIYSIARNSSKDISGININITNDTDLKISVQIDDDDKSNPRVYFKDSSNIEISRD